IENLYRRDRRLVVGQEQDVEAVRQRPVLHVQLRRRQRRSRHGRRAWRLGGGRLGGGRLGGGARWDDPQGGQQQQRRQGPSEHGSGGNMTPGRRTSEGEIVY